MPALAQGEELVALNRRRAALCSFSALAARPHDALQWITDEGARTVVRTDNHAPTAAPLADL